MVKEIQLREGEEVVAIVRRFPFTNWVQFGIAFILVVLPFFLLYPLFRWGQIGIVIFAVLLFIGVLYSIRVFVVWYFDSFIITNQRIIDIDQRGFFSRTVAQAQLHKIQDAAYTKRGIWQTILRYGNIYIQTAGAEMRLEMMSIYRPERVQELINRLHKEAERSEKRSDLAKIDDAPTAKDKVVRGLNHLDDDEMEEVLELMKRRAR